MKDKNLNILSQRTSNRLNTIFEMWCHKIFPSCLTMSHFVKPLRPPPNVWRNLWMPPKYKII